MAGHCWLMRPLETPKHLQLSLAESLVGSWLLSLGSWSAQGFVCALQESLILQSYGSSVIKSFWPSNLVRFPGDSGDLNLRIPGDSQSLCWIPRLRSLLWGLEFSQQCENFFGVIALPFVDHPPGGSVCAVLSQSVVSDFATPWTAAYQAPLVHGDSPGKNTGVACHALLQGIFPTQGLNPGPPHCKRVLYQLSHHGSPIVGLMATSSTRTYATCCTS